VEIIAMVEGIKFVLWLRELIQALGIVELKPIWVYQDNQSALTLATQLGKMRRAKHILIKVAYLKEQVDMGR
jgi:hypothetical protein